MMVAGPAGHDVGKLSVCMSSGCPVDVESPPQSVADVERSEFKAARHKATQDEVDDHKTSCTFEAARQSQGR